MVFIWTRLIDFGLDQITCNKDIGICWNSCKSRCESYTTWSQPVCCHIVTISIWVVTMDRFKVVLGNWCFLPSFVDFFAVWVHGGGVIPSIATILWVSINACVWGTCEGGEKTLLWTMTCRFLSLVILQSFVVVFCNLNVCFYTFAFWSNLIYDIQRPIHKVSNLKKTSTFSIVKQSKIS